MHTDQKAHEQPTAPAHDTAPEYYQIRLHNRRIYMAPMPDGKSWHVHFTLMLPPTYVHDGNPTITEIKRWPGRYVGNTQLILSTESIEAMCGLVLMHREGFPEHGVHQAFKNRTPTQRARDSRMVQNTGTTLPSGQTMWLTDDTATKDE